MNDEKKPTPEGRGDPPAFDPQAILKQMQAEYWESVEKAPEAEPEDLESLLVFQVGSERFAFAVNEVREITRVPPILSKVPRGAEILLGVMNLRGQIVPILDLRSTLGLKRDTPGAAARIVVLRGVEGDLGILAESVFGLVTLSASEWLGPLHVETALPAAFVKAQAKDASGVIVVLERSAFLSIDSLGSGI
jgi:chemotaxis signal transduction protein